MHHVASSQYKAEAKNVSGESSNKGHNIEHKVMIKAVHIDEKMASVNR
jgi:hypothetical protein